MKTALIIGDSLVQGVGATDSRGWAQIVAETFPSLEFDIQGVGSDTAEKVYARWPTKTYDLVILQVGTNDSCYRRYKDGPETPPERFAKYLALIHERFRPPATGRLLLVGLFGVDEARTNPFSADKSYTMASLNQYDAILAKVAKRLGIELVSLRERPTKPKWLSDGLHPSDIGHGWIASHVVKALRWRFGLVAQPPAPAASSDNAA